jgi:hypothetical protein
LELLLILVEREKETRVYFPWFLNNNAASFGETK